MLLKKNRADKKAIEKIFKEGKFLNSSSLTFKFILNSRFFSPRISFIVPKTISKKAVDRNLLRRRGYSALESLLKLFPPGIIGAFVFKKFQEDVSILSHEIKDILNKIN